MKRLVLITLLVASVASAGWFRTYGGGGYDEGHCVQEIEDGYIITGYTLSESPSGALLWLIKTDTNGLLIWDKTYGNPTAAGSLGNYVQQTKDGGYIITGQLGGDGKSDIWLVKTNDVGDTLWTKTYGETSGLCVKQTNENGYIIIGRQNWWPSKFFLLKTNSNGDSNWMRTFLLDDWVYSDGFFVEQTEDMGYIMTGMIGDTIEEAENEALWLIKTDSLGDTLWTYIQGGEYLFYEDNGRCVRQLKTDNYLIAGEMEEHAFLAEVDTEGNLVWDKTFSYGEAASCTERNEKTEHVVTGDAGTLASLARTASEDVWILNTNELGDSLWARTYVSGKSYHIEQTRDKGFIVTGTHDGDLFLLKTDSLGLLGITENPIVEADNGWNIPYSIGSYIVLHYQRLPQGFRANVFDVSGRQVDQITGDGNEGAMIWGINQPPGVYFIQAMDNRNQLKTAKVVLVR